MSFNLALQHQPIPPSPTSSSLTSLDDEVNNPAARVYFGPIQSPERILIAEATHKRNNLSSLPVRRSPRISALQNSQIFSSPIGKSAKAAGQTSGEQRGLKMALPSTPPGPDEDNSQDDIDIDIEPTSALATKISRAHDNPSPPPKMQPLEQESDNPPFPIPTEPHSPTDPAVFKASGSTIVDRPSPKVQTPSPPTVSHEPFASLDHRQSTSLSANTSANLIVFDDDNLSDVPNVEPIVEPFPDLLAPTPSRNRGPFSRGLESFRTILSGSWICSPGNKGSEHDHASPANVATIPPASTPPAIESPVQVCDSPRFSQLDCLSLHSTQSDLVPRDVDLPDTFLSQAHTGTSERTGPSVATEIPRHVRELGSLSPVSEDVLHNLLSTTEPTTSTTLDRIPALASVFPANQLSPDRPPNPERQPSPEQQNSPVPIQNVQRPPERSLWRTHIANPSSPGKFAFNNTLNDPNRTPARRIAINEAIAQRSASPRKDCTSGSSTGMFGRPVFSRHTSEDRTRSPIRRHPSDVVNHTAGAQSGIVKPTTSTSPEKVRCGSEEPQFSRSRPSGRSFQRSVSDTEISSPSKASRIPTFPNRTGIDARLPSTIPEEHGLDSPKKSMQSSPLVKSVLRQPSSVAGSRIPRIGVKPYARPPPEKEKQQGKGKEPVHKLFMTKRPTSTSVPTKPVRLVSSVNAAGSGSSSEDPVDFPAAAPGIPSNCQTSTSALPQPSPSLKRKRSVEDITSPLAAQPTSARLVTSVARQKSSCVLPTQPLDSGPSVKKTRIGHVRTVNGDTAQKRAARSAETQASVDETAKSGEQPGICPVSSPSQSHITPPALHTAPEQPTPPDVETEPALPPDIQPTTLLSELVASSSNSPSDSSLSTTLRITRSRRNPLSTSDVFGPVRPLQPRRRRTAETPREGTFSSMSALALKALTTTNTTKNQHNLVAILETEVVRKPGNRPGSPTIKLKTIEEKRKLEQGQGRKERAERRARRSSEILEDSSLTSDDEEMPLGPDGKPIRHRRGPGDEEDYESPERIERPEKRARIHETGEPGEEEGVGGKNVRWDRGLFTTIYYDDLPLQSWARDKPQVPTASTRGALAGSAKALRLDSLGNLVNATSPLKDLVQENVVIKKYVYDDDAEAAEIDEPKPSSKGKGKKTKG